VPYPADVPEASDAAVRRDSMTDGAEALEYIDCEIPGRAA
jgi:hypothetical protein